MLNKVVNKQGNSRGRLDHFEIEFEARIGAVWLIETQVLLSKVEFVELIVRNEKINNSVAKNVVQQGKVSEDQILLQFHQTRQSDRFSARLCHLANFQLATLQHNFLHLGINHLTVLAQ